MEGPTKGGFAFTTTMPSAPEESKGDKVTFRAPTSVAIETGHPNGAALTLELYATPSRPGFCYHVGRTVVVKDENGKMPNFLKQYNLPIPKWANHLLASSFLNQDALFLHRQERHLAKTGQYASFDDNGTPGGSEYKRAVNPIGVDGAVLAFRDWLKKFTKTGVVPYKNNPTMPEADSEVVFDVYNSHTKYCRMCQTALARLKKVRFAAFAASACLAALRPANKVAASFAGALLLSGVGLALNKIIGAFYRYEFSHSHND